jgi:diguanylate cyclase (GGDEF)-like protein
VADPQATTSGHRAEQVLEGVSWLVAFAGTCVALVLPGPSDGPAVRAALVVTLAVFFLVLLTRLLLAAARQPGRRVPLLLLAVGVALWASGSATVSASQTVNPVRFPAPGEALYLASYVGMAGFLLLDVRRRAGTTTAAWLETAVVCCASVCLAAFVVLTPVSGAFPRVPLLLAVLYPLLDLVLGTVVLAQVLLRQRSRSLREAGLALGFLALATADSSFVLSLATDDYSSSVPLDGLWGASFALVVGAACAVRRGTPSGGLDRQHTGVLLAASGVALAVLVVHPGGTIGWCVTVPAIVTLVCAGARMLLALREARGAAEAQRLSLTDELTGLPNRRALIAATDDRLRHGAPLGLLLLDLDGFKDVNDSLGHGVGDDVLVMVADRMRAALEPEILLSRLGGDEFALLAPVADEIDLLETANRIRTALQDPLRVQTLELSLDASVGITVREPDDATATELLRRADIAMYEAKASGTGALLFDPSQDGFSHHRLRRGEDLRQAIDGGQLRIWYQPQVDGRTRDVVSVEALVRWEHPDEGLLTPAAFLTDARRAGLMPALSEAVLDLVLADARRWLDAGFGFRVAMNWAPPELLGGRLLPRLVEGLHALDLPGDRLLVEVTEDSFLSDPERARDVLYELRAHQVQAAIDDYGTGFSSLAYLRDLPVQELKLDRTFVAAMTTDDRSRMIIQTTTQLAHALGLRVVAEGIEDAATATALVTLGIDVLQGYHVARPMPADEVAPWVRRWSTLRDAGQPGRSLALRGQR